MTVVLVNRNISNRKIMMTYQICHRYILFSINIYNIIWPLSEMKLLLINFFF